MKASPIYTQLSSQRSFCFALNTDAYHEHIDSLRCIPSRFAMKFKSKPVKIQQEKAASAATTMTATSQSRAADRDEKEITEAPSNQLDKPKDRKGK